MSARLTMVKTAGTPLCGCWKWVIGQESFRTSPMWSLCKTRFTSEMNQGREAMFCVSTLKTFIGDFLVFAETTTAATATPTAATTTVAAAAATTTATASVSATATKTAATTATTAGLRARLIHAEG